MMETLMVAVVFIVVLLVALGFYFKFSLQSAEEAGEEACLVSNTVLLSTVTAMPEIQCSIDTKTEDCIDTSKLIVFDASDVYGGLFSTNCPQRVSFLQVYPAPENGSCTSNTYPDCASFLFYDPNITYSSAISISTPITLYYPLTDTFTFGRLKIEVLK